MKMIPVSDLILFECPNCGYQKKAKKDEEIVCPKCDPYFKGWASNSGICTILGCSGLSDKCPGDKNCNILKHFSNGG